MKADNRCYYFLFILIQHLYDCKYCIKSCVNFSPQSLQSKKAKCEQRVKRNNAPESQQKEYAQDNTTK